MAKHSTHQPAANKDALQKHAALPRVIYHVILHRPAGSHCWTPYGDVRSPAGNFFANRSLAVDFARKLMSENRQEYLPGPRKYVPLEFNVGSVSIDSMDPVQPF